MKTKLALLRPVLLALTLAPAGAAVRYVNLANPSPAPPYTDWASAATNIQDAIDAAHAGDEVVVTNGVYASGGRTDDGLTNRVVVTGVTLRSVNGPAVTVIQGYQVPGTTNGAGAVRCVYLTDDAALVGFTLTGGATLLNTGQIEGSESGGGIWCASSSAVVSDCVIRGNSASWFGGGVRGGTLNSCTIADNSAGDGGGGVAFGTLTNCTISRNSAGWGGGARGGFKDPIAVVNCILYYNTATNAGPDLYGVANFPANTVFVPQAYSCIGSSLGAVASGPGNITNAPLFVDPGRGDFRLQSNSPCINAGLNSLARQQVPLWISTATGSPCIDDAGLNSLAPPGPDLDGLPHVVGGTVDMGAYEFQSPLSRISYAWLQQYALPTDGSVDNLDLDGDGLKNWQEWRAGTDPTNALSTLRLLTPNFDGTHWLVSWQSVPERTYTVERSVNLSASNTFLPVAATVPGQSGTTSVIDTNLTALGPAIYRVRVEE